MQIIYNNTYQLPINIYLIEKNIQNLSKYLTTTSKASVKAKWACAGPTHPTHCFCAASALLRRAV